MSGRTTRNKTTPERDRRGRFETKQCGCLQHDNFESVIQGKCWFESCTSNKKRKHYQELIARKLITAKHKWVCNKCLKYSKLHFVKTASRLSSKRDISVLNVSYDERDAVGRDDVIQEQSDDEHDEGDLVDEPQNTSAHDMVDEERVSQ